MSDEPMAWRRPRPLDVTIDGRFAGPVGMPLPALLRVVEDYLASQARPVVLPPEAAPTVAPIRPLLPALAALLGTDEATARDWLIAKVAAFRGEGEAATAARLDGLL